MSDDIATDYVLGEHRDKLTPNTCEQHAALATSMVQQASRTLVMVTRHLDPRITNNPAFCEAVKTLALRSKLSRIRMLIRDVEPLMKDGHCLLELTRRLTSFMEIRMQGKDYREFNEAFLVVDATGYLHRRHGDRYEGVACFNDMLGARELNKRFQEMWDASVIDPNLKRLHL
jgi:hypothetical protein